MQILPQFPWAAQGLCPLLQQGGAGAGLCRRGGQCVLALAFITPITQAQAWPFHCPRQ